ncbi:MAG: sulfatase-like hydrolase/transferase [Gemmataceae bacterium]|nr:sulfatase-like hydrolase/transferase [Gemmataceae bacterium]MCI0743141.1 sulfatase-like hydrolase/transferase [Gemmataceae bacterium]
MVRHWTACVLLTAAWLGIWRPLAASEPAKPNIVLILMDDLGHADLGCTGAKDIKTPNIDRIAREGVRLTNFYANAPVCTPTRAALLTGRYQQRVGLEWALGFTAEQKRRQGNDWVAEPDMLALGLSPADSVLARLLKGAGYRTGIIGKWHLGYRAEFNPIRHGFDEYFGVLLGHADYYTYKYYDGTPCLFENEKPAKATGYLTDHLNQRAVDFVRRHATEPFFLYVPHLAVHFPFQVPDKPGQLLTKENLSKGSRQAYAAMLERADQGVGMLLDELDKQGIADNTLVIFTSDNGGYQYSDNTPFFHHKSTLWEGGVRVPCLMRWPARLGKNKTHAQPGITMDLTATILAAAGAANLKDARLEGINLLPILTGEKPAQERTFFWRIDRSDRKQKAVRHGNWKFLHDGMIELLFDLENDVSERHNLAYRRPEIVTQLRRLLADWEADLAKEPPAFVVK